MKITTRSCPNCQKPSDEMFRPFCSKRCADVDLNRWLKGAYSVPTEEEPSEEDLRANAANTLPH